jgi:hypothetical protein
MQNTPGNRKKLITQSQHTAEGHDRIDHLAIFWINYQLFDITHPKDE